MTRHFQWHDIPIKWHGILDTELFIFENFPWNHSTSEFGVKESKYGKILTWAPQGTLLEDAHAGMTIFLAGNQLYELQTHRGGCWGWGTAAWLEATGTILGSPQNESRCIYKGRGRLPRPSKSHLQKTKPNLQMTLSGTGQSAPGRYICSHFLLHPTC